MRDPRKIFSASSSGTRNAYKLQITEVVRKNGDCIVNTIGNTRLEVQIVSMCFQLIFRIVMKNFSIVSWFLAGVLQPCMVNCYCDGTLATDQTCIILA